MLHAPLLLCSLLWGELCLAATEHRTSREAGEARGSGQGVEGGEGGSKDWEGWRQEQERAGGREQTRGQEEQGLWGGKGGGLPPGSAPECPNTFLTPVPITENLAEA